MATTEEPIQRAETTSSSHESAEELEITVRHFNRRYLFAGIAFGILIAAVLYALLRSVIAVWLQDPTIMQSYADFLSGIGTVGLVLLTAVYVLWTWQLVVEAKAAREQDRVLALKERKQERQMREQERLESWYEEILFGISSVKQNCDDEIFNKDSWDEVAFDKLNVLLDELDSFAETLEGHLRRHPRQVSSSVIETSRDFLRHWEEWDKSGKLEYNEQILTDVEELEEEILTESEWWNATVR